jgi:hypothetical protein
MTDKDDFAIWVLNTGGAIVNDAVAWSAWQAALKLERSKAPICHGVSDKDCNYMMSCYARVCNKCGRKHRGAGYPEKAPAWHSAPTVPGDWVLSLASGLEMQEQITQAEIDADDHWPGRWFGPIPEDKTT